MIEFFAQGEPKPQPRPRAFARNMGGGKFAARVYDAGTAEGWKGCVALAARPHLPVKPLTGALSVTMEFVFTRPKGHLRSNGAVKPGKPEYPTTTRMDLDNLGKAVADCLTAIGMWSDDALIVKWVLSKQYGDRPGARVRVIEVTASDFSSAE